ncbi:hypothetical protein AWJ20_4650 [Sugiyamaella lignohabitans]|uniref:Uncharacterized protein n=1 Tax=Sugiyamaella lignohabitans TaxID=796027 RepID=A0A161HKS3_9ASCO|nr:uncharacterized protein AWJ20_4650 [Sugiyamaella lignohabitans]ANB13707.1 hypothetical protein AWJ20_4650 [Sugiyamaella lignohabitans]
MKFSTIAIATVSAATVVNASYSYSPQVNDFLNKIDIAKAQVYDQAGSLRDDLIDSWSDSQLKEWLDAHSLYDVHTSATKDVKGYAASLKEQVLAHKDVLVEDIKSYQAAAAANAQPYIGKSKEFVADTGAKAGEVGAQAQVHAQTLLGHVQQHLYTQYENVKSYAWDLYKRATAYSKSKVDL